MSLLAAMLTTVAVSAQQEDAQKGVNQYGQKVESHPVQATVQDGIMVFQNKEIDYKLWFDIRLQTDAAVFFGAPDFCDKNLNGEENSSHIGSGASIRRARFAIKAQLSKDWYAEFDTDWTSGTPEIKDAILAFTGLKDWEFKAGNFKENFSIQRNTTSRYLMFMERAMITGLAPSRHLGFNVKYSHPLFWASAGVFGPELKSSEEMTTMEDNNKDYGRDEGLSYTGKVVLRPLYKRENASLHIGAAVSYREPKLTGTDGYAVARYSTRNSTNINRKKYLDTDDITGLDHELAWTAEVAGHYNALRYEAAYIARGAFLDKNLNKEGLDKTQWADGWYVQASYLLFGGKQSYDANGAKYSRTTSDRKWGNLEVAFRYEYADFNTADYKGGSGEAYTIGINYYPIKNVKLMLNYQYNNNDRFANAKGKVYTGYDLDGNPTKDPMRVADKSGNGGVDYHMLAMRLQVAF